MAVIDIDKNSFKSEVLNSKLPVVIDFWAEWCGPCRIFSPVVENISKDYENKVKFYKLNTDENPEIAEAYNVMSIPTALLFENGEVKAISIGAVPLETFRRWLEENIRK
jgi:thioredoxin 1